MDWPILLCNYRGENEKVLKIKRFTNADGKGKVKG